MPTYLIEGKKVKTDNPLSEDEIDEIASSIKGQGSTSTASDQSSAETARLSRQQPKTEPKSMMEQMFGLGSPIARVAKGAIVNPLLGVNQALANLIPFDNPVTRGANQNVRDVNNAVDTARGDTGFDPFQFTGEVISPVNKLFPSAGSGSTVLQKIGTGAGQGVAQAMITPTSGNDDTFIEEKLTQAGFGGVLGGAVPLTAATAKRMWKFIADLPITAKAKEAAIQRHIVSLLPKDKTDVVAALKNAPEIVPGSKPTVAEALADTPAGAKLVREQQTVSRAEPQKFLEREAQQKAAREGLLVGQFGDDAALEAAKKARTAATMPLKDKALEYADAYGKYGPKLAKLVEDTKKEASKVSPSDAFGYSSKYQKNLHETLTKATAFREVQLKSLADSGFYPLSVSPLTSKIDDILSTPGQGSNSLLAHGLTAVKNKLARFQDENGIIKSVDLYNIRKEVNDDIAAYLKNTTDNTALTTDAGKAASTIRNLLDAQINKASGSTLWTDYLKNYAAHSEKINRMEVGQELIKKLTGNLGGGEHALGDVQRASAFAAAIENAAGTIKRASGQRRYDKIGDILTDQQNRAVNSVYADLSRLAKASDVSGKVGSTGKVDVPGIPLETLNQKVTIIKSVLNALKRGSEADFNARMTELHLDPQAMALLIEKTQTAKAPGLVEAMYQKASPEVRKMLETLVPPRGTIMQRGIQEGLRTDPEEERQ